MYDLSRWVNASTALGVGLLLIFSFKIVILSIQQYNVYEYIVFYQNRPFRKRNISIIYVQFRLARFIHSECSVLLEKFCLFLPLKNSGNGKT